MSFLDSLLSWFRDEFQAFGLWLYQSLLDALAAVINAIPVPSWAQTAPDLFSRISPSVGYFLSAFNFSFGVSVLLSAYLIRFIVRRLPVIG